MLKSFNVAKAEVLLLEREQSKHSRLHRLGHD